MRQTVTITTELFVTNKDGQLITNLLPMADTLVVLGDKLRKAIVDPSAFFSDIKYGTTEFMEVNSDSDDTRWYPYFTTSRHHSKGHVLNLCLAAYGEFDDVSVQRMWEDMLPCLVLNMNKVFAEYRETHPSERPLRLVPGTTFIVKRNPSITEVVNNKKQDEIIFI